MIDIAFNQAGVTIVHDDPTLDEATGFFVKRAGGQCLFALARGAVREIEEIIPEDLRAEVIDQSEAMIVRMDGLRPVRTGTIVVHLVN
ncbi:conserved hypothetical protein [Hyphomicrobiales bacterium]|jgi:hypothetical protein|nr:conserved hypothetical protein [Hyphomicrobiales bacterium]CAH1702377.1 conserved hypothetical protein [Hyphomicrobiales bacterium]CAI0346577.1 conserved hypothetical protein [Hyphomicrobiales bacterium]